MQSIKEVSDDFLVLAFHLHFVELSHQYGVVVGGLERKGLISYKYRLTVLSLNRLITL